MRPVSKLNVRQEPTPARPDADSARLSVGPLADEKEALRFLAGRSIPTAFMTTLIRDNGLRSPLNRGTFYGCRDRAGRLEGVALVGHATMFEARTEEAVRSFAELAKGDTRARVLLGEQEEAARFVSHYAGPGWSPRAVNREMLFEQRKLVEVHQPVPGLRPATLADLEAVVEVHAAMAYEESGVNPLERDPVGFRVRTARRLEQGRVWVWAEGGRLVFKADVVADTPEVTYLEGVYVHPDERGRGYGLRCISQLGRTLLSRTRSICLLVQEQNHAAREFFRRADYTLRGYYDTIYLQ
jgi:predicted GNAT family acetyltransferase